MVFADSVNIARRLSAKNENDMLQQRVTGKWHDIVTIIFTMYLHSKFRVAMCGYVSYF